MTPPRPTPDVLPRTLLSRRVFLTAGGTAVVAACVACSNTTSGAATSAAATTSGGSTTSSPSTSASASADSTASAITEPSTSSASSTSTAGPTTTSAATSTSAQPASSTEATTSAPRTTTSSESSSTSAAPAGTVVANVADIPSGGGLIVSGPDGSPLILADNNGTVVAHSAICTHQGAEIGGDGVCSKHGSIFDIVTGAVLNGPATSALPEVTVTVADGKVYAT